MPASLRPSSIALDVVAAAFVLVAFMHGQRVTADLEWPGDPDMFRDLAVAQSMVDCRCLADPHYRGELLWYNPLTAGVVATLSSITGRPVHLVQVRDGAWLNLLAPFGFYVLAVVIAGRFAAVPALVAFLFLGPGRLFDTATYSPWLMSPNFAQSFFYLGLAVYLCAAERDRAWWWIASGALAGMAVLGHTAAAILLTAVVGVDVVASVAQSSSRRRLAGRALLMAMTAVVVASPFLYVVLWRYQGHVLNPVPTVWIDRSMELERLGSFVRAHLLRPVMVPVAIGFAAMFTGAIDGRRRRALLVWAGTCLLFLAYSYLWQWYRAEGVTLPTVVPEFHFLRLLDAAEHLWFGLGIAVVAHAATARMGAPKRPTAGAVVVVTIVAALAAALAWPQYRERHDLVAMRVSSQGMYRDEGLARVRDWLRTSTTPDAVILADANVSFAVVAPAGRRVMEVPAFFSSTFVDWGERHDASNAMWSALTASNCAGLSELADRFHVTHAIDQSTARWTRSIQAACGWTPAFRAGDWVVFAAPRGAS